MASVIDQLKVFIRCMIRRDLNEIFKIEQQSFDYSWRMEDFVYCQRKYPGLVAEHKNKIVGFIIFEFNKGVYVINFAVHPDYRRLGVGRQIINKLVSNLQVYHHSNIKLNVRETNLVALNFFKSQHFRATKVIRNYYEDTGEDGYLMEYKVDDSDNNQEVILAVSKFTKKQL